MQRQITRFFLQTAAQLTPAAKSKASSKAEALGLQPFFCPLVIDLIMNSVFCSRVLEASLLGLIALAAFTTADKGGIVNSTIVSWHQCGFLVIFLLWCRVLGLDPLSFRVGPKYVKTTFLIVALAFALALSYAASPIEVWRMHASFDRLLQIYLHFLFFFCCVFLCLQRPYFAGALLITVALSLAAVAFYCWYLIVFVDAYPYRSESYWNNWLPFNSNKRHMGFDMLVGAIISTGLAMVSHGWRRLLFYSSAVACVALIFWLGGRATILALFGGFALIWRFTSARCLAASPLVALSSLLILGVILSELAALFPWNGLFGALVDKIDATDLNRYSSGRLSIWAYCLELIAEHWLLGLGPQAFFNIPDSPFRVFHPHNGFIQIALEFGVLGLILFLLIFYRPIFAALLVFARPSDLSHQSPFIIYSGWIAAAAMLALLFQSIFSGVFYHGKPSFYLAISMAILWSAYLRSRATSSTNPPPGSA